MEEVKNREADVNDKSIVDESNKNSIDASLVSSDDQLICKTPRESPNCSVKNLVDKPAIKIIADNDNSADDGDAASLFWLGVLHCFFGVMMAVFGVLVIEYEANLAQIGGGIWAGFLAITTGVAGVLASAREWCPLKKTPQKIAHTIFLALSLISLAVSQLIMALAATGAGRDINSSQQYDVAEEYQITTQVPPGKISIILPMNYLSILCNLGLVIVSLCECIVAAIASYKSSRLLCPCFRPYKRGHHQNMVDGGSDENRNALVSSWLGKHTPTPVYIVTGSSLSKSSKISSSLPMTPVFAFPPHLLHQPPQPRFVYPLIPAPLGQIPSPIIPPSPPRHRDMLREHNRRKKYHQSKFPTPHRRSRSKSKSMERTITADDVARTYTGLDKAIAEEFIDMCESKNTSLCSDSSCNCTSNSDVASSKDYLVK